MNGQKIDFIYNLKNLNIDLSVLKTKMKDNQDVKLDKQSSRFGKKQKRWNKEEKIRYLIALAVKREIFQEKFISKQTFEQMAKFIGSDKGQYECYNLHDRMKQKYGSVENIISAIKQKLKVDDKIFEKEVDHKLNEINEVKSKIQTKKHAPTNYLQCYQILSKNNKFNVNENEKKEQQKQKQQKGQNALNRIQFQGREKSLKVQMFKLKGGRRFKCQLNLPLLVELENRSIRND